MYINEPNGSRTWTRSNQTDPSRAYLIAIFAVLVGIGIAWTFFFHALGWKLGC